MDGPGSRPNDGTEVLDTDQLARQAKLIDWTRTRAWAPLAGNGAVHLVRQDEEHPAGVPDSNYQEYRAGLMASLAAAPEVKQVWTAEELYSGPHLQLAPDLVVEPKPRIRISPLASAATSTWEATLPAETPAGILWAFGPLYQPGLLREPVSLLDAACLLFYSLGLPVPSDLEGRVPLAVIDPARLHDDPPRIENAVESPPAAAPRLDPRTEAEILERLRSLGYVE